MCRRSTGFATLLAITSVALMTAMPAAAQRGKILHTFNNNGKDGYLPVARVVLDSAGNLYGTTETGGTGSCTAGGLSGCGTVFELSPKAGGGYGERILHSFANDGIDGTSPRGGLILDSSGNLYGTTYYGGSGTSVNCADSGGCGTVFELSPQAGGAWREKILHSFTQDGVDGILPDTALTIGTDGNLYGITDSGGANYYWGTVFQLTPIAGGSWTETILHSFNSNGSDGFYPNSALVFDAAGNLYGTTYDGGASSAGVVFELSPQPGGSWTEEIFSIAGGLEGNAPVGGVVIDAAGNLYGTTINGGAVRNSGGGLVFQLSPQSGGGWKETVLHIFDPNLNGMRGQFPEAGVILDAWGNLYGTTFYGGTGTCTGGGGAVIGCGIVFELSPAAGGGWSGKILHSFANNGADGHNPVAGLIFDSAGKLYGTTQYGGANGDGTVFELTP
jgi:uncharacterized repeat protein (TIGR03803 family)